MKTTKEYPREVHVLIKRIIDMERSDSNEIVRQAARKLLNEWDKVRP